MKVLSIDVGIKNLALCLFEKPSNSNNFQITKWDVINVSESETMKCCFTDKNILCNKPAKFKKDKDFFCLKHSKKQKYQIPTSELKSSFINKQKIQKLFEIADKNNIKYDKPIKKIDLVNVINEHIHNNYFQEVKTINASKIDLITIGANIKDKFNEIFSGEISIDFIDYVIIENQISPIANRMKTIQGMIVQYFIMSDVVVENIEFISALNKLKDCDIKDKLKYSDRKKLGIAKCLEIITTDHRFNNKLDYFKLHTKKDDLSDCFLQALWFINENKL
jgi:hypothetical protein